jgi:hypothetical protein
MRTPRWFVISWLVIAPALLGAQNEAPVARKLLLHVEQAGGTGYTRNELFMISRSIMLSLNEGVSGISVIESPEGQLPTSGSQINQLTQSNGADCWLWIELSKKGAGTAIRARSFDIRTSEQTFDETLSRDARISALDLPYEKWSDVVSLVAWKYGTSPTIEGGPSAAKPEQNLGNAIVLTIHALPGTVIKGGHGLSATAGPDGTAQMTLPASAEYSLRAELTDYYPSRKEYFLPTSSTIEIPQVPASRWTLDLSMIDIQYPSIDVGRFIIPNWLFVKLGITTQYVGIAMTNDSFLANEPLTSFLLQAGGYFSPEDVLLRFYGTAGLFMSLSTPSGTNPSLDHLAPGGVQISLGTEIGGTTHGSFFLEWKPAFYFSPEPDYQSSFGNNGTPGWIFPSWGAFNILTIKIGYRWLF